jgi:citrate lyase subunit beta/citryl-CoA lyase
MREPVEMSGQLRRRSCLSVPGSSPKMIAKAATIAADEIVFDLEDAVAASGKEEARALVVDALSRPEWKERTVAVRVNALGTPWCEDDLVAMAESTDAPASVVLPKVERPGDLEYADQILARAEVEGRAPIALQALIETAAGLREVNAIAAAESTRLAGLILGYADLAASLGRSPATAADPTAWLAAQDAVLVAARAAGVQAIDGPFLGTQVDEAFRRATLHVAGLGFDGKWAIHPSQVEELNAAFTPTAADLDWAEQVIAALEAADRDGAGAVALDGQMLDEAVAVAARRLLGRAGRPG